MVQLEGAVLWGSYAVLVSKPANTTKQNSQLAGSAQAVPALGQSSGTVSVH